MYIYRNRFKNFIVISFTNRFFFFCPTTTMRISGEKIALPIPRSSNHSVVEDETPGAGRLVPPSKPAPGSVRCGGTAISPEGVPSLAMGASPRDPRSRRASASGRWSARNRPTGMGPPCALLCRAAAQHLRHDQHLLLSRCLEGTKHLLHRRRLQGSQRRTPSDPGDAQQLSHPVSHHHTSSHGPHHQPEPELPAPGPSSRIPRLLRV